LGILLVSCSTSTPNKSNIAAMDAAAFAGPQLTAKLVMREHANVYLQWKNKAIAPGGNFIEAAFNNPQNEFFVLGACEMDVTELEHSDLAPDTTFIYRIHPFFGYPSAAVGIQTSNTNQWVSKPFVRVKDDHSPTPSPDREGPLQDLPGSNTNLLERFSVRAMGTMARAVPSDLSASLCSAISVDLRWKNHAKDEDGYLVEVSTNQDKGFLPCAVLPPATTSFRKAGLSPETMYYFRVLAFFYGKPSNLAVVHTPVETILTGTNSRKAQPVEN